MAIDYKVWEFPSFPISKQLFHVPGAMMDGGLTSGGARIGSPEPGGFSMLEIQPALSVNEWIAPAASWLMSKTNGQILRVRLAPTPQIADARISKIYDPGTPWGPEGALPETPWSNQQNWSGDASAAYSANSLAGSNVLYVNMGTIGNILKPGHVIGHNNTTYLIDEIAYSGAQATVVVTPPLRNDVVAGDKVFFRSWFTGLIVNGAEFRTTYDASLVGNIQLNTIQLREVVL